MVITGIDEKSKNRSALSVDGVIRVWLNNDIIAEKGLRLGDEITEEELHSLMEYNDDLKVKNKAFELLSYRDHSEKELRKKLSDRKFAEDSIDETIERLTELGYINDEKFAENYYRDLIFNRKFSKRRAIYELQKKGIERDLISVVTEEVEVDETETLLNLMRGKYSSKMISEEKRKTLSQTLIRNGFSWGDVKSAFLRYDEENEDD
jgi:regulatory protein